jgi:(S)-2-hydroxyglutarate dehydrogenase
VAAQIDVLVVGGGILGLATSHCLLARRPGTSIVVLEKEPAIARHQTGRNSGVLHSGIYYTPGSLKATNCRVGKSAMERFCAEEAIPYEICGKVIVAVTEAERPRLEALLERGRANGVRCERIVRERLRELEPHAAGVEALHVPETGIVDYRLVCERLAARIADRGGHVVTGAQADAFSQVGNRTIVSTSAGEYDARIVVNCAGLQSDRVTRLAGGRPPARIVPFRGEYFELVPQKRHLCRNLIYPVPDPAFPFLGVHFTRRIGGGVECGPNAVLALAREGYTKGTVNLRDMWETLTYGGFLRLARRHWRTGAGEVWRSISKRAFTHALRRLLPEIAESDLEPAPSGVRAQAVAPDGSMVDDFLIVEDERAVHVNNAPSPAATASLEIGRVVTERVMARLR